MSSTLCWSCERACGGCSWSDKSFTPVEGWIAEKTIYRAKKDKFVTSYVVKSCPLYKPLNYKQVQLDELVKLLHTTKRTFMRRTRKDKIQLANRFGYDLKIDKGDSNNEYYIALR